MKDIYDLNYTNAAHLPDTFEKGSNNMLCGTSTATDCGHDLGQNYSISSSSASSFTRLGWGFTSLLCSIILSLIALLSTLARLSRNFW